MFFLAKKFLVMFALILVLTFASPLTTSSSSTDTYVEEATGMSGRRLVIVDNWQRVFQYEPQVQMSAQLAFLAINRAMNANYSLKRVIGAKLRVNTNSRTYKLFLELNDPSSFYEVYCEATVLLRNIKHQQLRAFDCDRQLNDISLYNQNISSPNVIYSPPQ